MSGSCGRQRRRVTALVVAALCSVIAPLANPTAARADGPLTLVAGATTLPTGRVVAHLPNGATGPVTLSIGACVPHLGLSCLGVLSAFSLIGNFKDAAGNPLYSDED